MGEWIKVEKVTADKPEVLRMARALKMDRDAVLGKLLRIWVWFDSNSVDGVVDGAVDADVDGLASHVGFAIAMRQVGWLGAADVHDREGAGLCLPNFVRHNGESSKKRALKTQRQTRWRQTVDAAQSTNVDAPTSTSASTRIEKIREEVTTSPPSEDLSGKPDDARKLNGKGQYVPEAQKVLDYLNRTASRSFEFRSPAGKLTANADTIIARLQEGYTGEQLREVVLSKSEQWRGDEKMADYLRPETLFNRTKFQTYLGELSRG